MRIKNFLKSPEKTMSEWGGLEWTPTRRDAVAGALAVMACVSALALEASQSGSRETADVVPVHETVEVDD